MNKFLFYFIIYAYFFIVLREYNKSGPENTYSMTLIYKIKIFIDL